MDNYYRKITKLIAEGVIKSAGGIRHLHVEHDDWCKLLKKIPDPCNCDPDISQDRMDCRECREMAAWVKD